MAKIDTFKLKGQILDARYQVESVVGEGGFGVVYRATQVNFDEPVAIKVLKIPGQLSAKDTEVFVDTFRAEGKHLRKLSLEHPAFVRAHDTGVINVDGVPAPYLVLEWLDGFPLEDDLAERREKGQQGRSLQESMELIEPIFGALAHAHAQRVAHRDIKPANIFVIRTKDGKSSKLLDFGMAKVMTTTGTQGLHAATQGGLSGLTPSYAAPEQWDKKMSATGPWTDVYSLALVLVELLTDKPPLDGDDMPSLMASTLDEEIRPTPTVRGATVTSAVEAVFAKALALHPKDRYRHAGEFWNALLEAAEKVAAIGTEQTLVRIQMPEGEVLQPGEVALDVPAARKIPDTRVERASQSELSSSKDSARLSQISQISEKSSSRIATAETSAEIKVPTLPPPAPAETKKSSNPVVFLLAAILVVLGIIAWKWQGGGSAEKTAALPTVAESKPASVETAEAPKPKKKGKKWWEEAPETNDTTAKAAVPKLAVNRQKWLGLREQSLALDAEKKREDAEKTLRAALDLACKEFGEQDPACAETMKLLAMVLFRMGKMEDAEKLLRQAVKLNAEFGDEDDEEFDDSRQALIAVLVKQGKLEEAKEFWTASDPPLAPPKPSASAAASAAPKTGGSAARTPAAEDSRDPWTQIMDELHEEKASGKQKAPANSP